MLHVIEIFNSIQGEGSHTGFPCAFVRLARCNVRCGYCDTTYSFGSGQPWEQQAIVDEVESYGVHHVCVTGGEPMLHGEDACSLMSAFGDLGYTVILETNGVIPLETVPSHVTKVVDVKTPGAFSMDPSSPKFVEKHFHYPNLESLDPNDELKFVLTSRDDYEWSKRFVEEYALIQKVSGVYFSPSWGQVEPAELAQWILGDKLAVKLNLQIHKYIWSPDTRGV